MRILQITDLHIGKDGEDTFGVDVRKNFHTILKEARTLNPDHIVITGDLCYTSGDNSVYQWIYHQLESLKIPYSIIAGNHDDTQMMAEVFGLKENVHEGALYYTNTINGQKNIYLDTSDGTLPAAQMRWLKKELQTGDEPIFIFMHHPPAHVGVPFMDDNYPLKNYQEVQKILLDSQRELVVFSGHYHVEKMIDLGRLHVYITPSTFFQIDQESKSFKVDHHKIGIRGIDCLNGNIQTNVRYFDGHYLKSAI